MASICINKLNISPAAFSSITCNAPRRSLSGEMRPHVKLTDLPEEEPEPDLDDSDIADFEFSFSDPVNVIPADELFANGKLFPVTNAVKPDTSRIINGVSAVDSFLYSQNKAPKCSSSSSSRWKELLGLKKLYQNAKTTSSAAKTTSSAAKTTSSAAKTTSSAAKTTSSGKVAATATSSIKQFLNISTKSVSSTCSVNVPLLNDTDNDLLTSSSSSHLSHSSSSSDEVQHRLSLDSDKPSAKLTNANIRPAMKTVKTRTLSSDGNGSMRLVSIDSPRMNSSGKIVFHSLERSSSSPSTFSGGSRIKSRRLMERSHSATVRFTPVLNVPVPVCSIRGSKFSSSSNNNGGPNKSKQVNLKTKSDRS